MFSRLAVLAAMCLGLWIQNVSAQETQTNSSSGGSAISLWGWGVWSGVLPNGNMAFAQVSQESLAAEGYQIVKPTIDEAAIIGRALAPGGPLGPENWEAIQEALPTIHPKTPGAEKIREAVKNSRFLKIWDGKNPPRTLALKGGRGTPGDAPVLVALRALITTLENAQDRALEGAILRGNHPGTDGIGFSQDLGQPMPQENLRSPQMSWAEWAQSRGKTLRRVEAAELESMGRPIQWMVTFPGLVLPLAEADIDRMLKANWNDTTAPTLWWGLITLPPGLSPGQSTSSDLGLWAWKLGGIRSAEDAGLRNPPSP